MTTQVLIALAPGNHSDVDVHAVNNDNKHLETKRIRGDIGGAVQFYVWDGKNIFIEEVKKVKDGSATNAESQS